MCVNIQIFYLSLPGCREGSGSSDPLNTVFLGVRVEKEEAVVLLNTQIQPQLGYYVDQCWYGGDYLNMGEISAGLCGHWARKVKTGSHRGREERRAQRTWKGRRVHLDQG